MALPVYARPPPRGEHSSPCGARRPALGRAWEPTGVPGMLCLLCQLTLSPVVTLHGQTGARHADLWRSLRVVVERATKEVPRMHTARWTVVALVVPALAALGIACDRTTSTEVEQPGAAQAAPAFSGSNNDDDSDRDN